MDAGTDERSRQTRTWDDVEKNNMKELTLDPPGTRIVKTKILDPEEYRPDFPILHQKVHGKQLVYLDNPEADKRDRDHFILL